MNKDKKNRNLTDYNGDVRELLQADINVMSPMEDVLPDLVVLHKRSKGRPRKAVKSLPTSIRLRPVIAQRIKKLGRGWQTKINDALEQLILENKL